MKHFLALGLVCLTGCASVAPHTQDDIYGSLQRFKGRNIQEVAAQFGLPDSQRNGMAGETVYRWNATREFESSRTVRTKTTGRVGTGLSSVPYQETTTTQQPVVDEWHCVLDMGVVSGVVIQIGFNGNIGACQEFFIGQ